MIIPKWVVPCVVCVCIIDVCYSKASLTTEIHESNEFNAPGQRAFVSGGDIPVKSSPLLVNRVSDRPIREQPPNSPFARSANRPQKLPITSTKLTSTLPPPDETNNESETNIEEDEEPYVGQREEEISPIPSTTEVPKKRIVNAGRPFRSQQDLVESLKRRRLTQQQGPTTTAPTTSTSATDKIQSKSTMRKYGNTNRGPSYTSGESNSFSRKSSSNRRYNTKSTTPSNVEDADLTELPQPTARSGRTHSRRTSN